MLFTRHGQHNRVHAHLVDELPRGRLTLLLLSSVYTSGLWILAQRLIALYSYGSPPYINANDGSNSSRSSRKQLGDRGSQSLWQVHVHTSHMHTCGAHARTRAHINNLRKFKYTCTVPWLLAASDGHAHVGRRGCHRVCNHNTHTHLQWTRGRPSTHRTMSYLLATMRSIRRI